jgi:hypothetical protein
VIMKSAVFWDVAPYSSCVNLRFGGTYRLHLQGRKIRERGISVFSFTVTDLVLIYESVTSSASVVRWLTLHS